MFGIGGFELLIIVIFIFVIFGPDKMPEITKYAGKAIKKFRNAKQQVDDIVNTEVVEPIMRESNKPDKPKSERVPEVTSAKVNSSNDNAASVKKQASKKSNSTKPNRQSSLGNNTSSTKKPTSNTDVSAKKPATNNNNTIKTKSSQKKTSSTKKVTE